MTAYTNRRLNNLLIQIGNNKEAFEVAIVNAVADAYAVIQKPMRGNSVSMKEFAKAFLIIAGAMRFRFVDFNEVHKIVIANDRLKNK